MKKSRQLSGFVSTFLILFLTFQLYLGAQREALDTIAGEQRPIGKGTVRTWLKVDTKSREPRVIGVTVTESGLSGLPGEADPAQEGTVKLKLMDGGPNHTFEYELKFPPEAAETAFHHMGFNWNPVGHGPEGVFTMPHFD